MFFGASMDHWHAATLQRVRASFTEYIPEGTMASENLRVVVESRLDEMAVKLGTTILAHQLPPNQVTREEVVIFHWPATWWQMFKQQYRDSRWLGWLARRWPVRTVPASRSVVLTVDLTRYHAYPEALAYLPEYGRPVKGYDLVVRTRQYEEREESAWNQR